MGLLLIYVLFQKHDTIPNLFITFCVLLFLFNAPLIFRQLTNKKIILLNNQGVYYYINSFNTHRLFIPWNKIKKVKNKQIADQWCVSLYLVKDKYLLASIPKKYRRVIQMNRAKGHGEIIIDLQSAKSCTNEELIQQMDQFRYKNF